MSREVSRGRARQSEGELATLGAGLAVWRFPTEEGKAVQLPPRMPARGRIHRSGSALSHTGGEQSETVTPSGAPYACRLVSKP
jgi:hypothetical protein